MTFKITAEQVKGMFPNTLIANIRKHLPDVIAALEKYGLADKEMVLMALATIRAETEGFVPIREFKSKYNTTFGSDQLFDLYDNRKDLGHDGTPGIGFKYRGAGYIQLTGKYNYKKYGELLGKDLEDFPDLANKSDIAASILALFLKDKEKEIREALSKGDMKKARRLVNGGLHGMDRFTDAYERGVKEFSNS